MTWYCRDILRLSWRLPRFVMVLSRIVKVCHSIVKGLSQLSWFCHDFVMVCHGLSRFVTVCHKVVMVCHRDKMAQKKGLFDHDKKSLWSVVITRPFFRFSGQCADRFFWSCHAFFFVTMTICDKTWQSILSPWQTPWQDFWSWHFRDMSFTMSWHDMIILDNVMTCHVHLWQTLKVLAKPCQSHAWPCLTMTRPSKVRHCIPDEL